MHLTWGMTRSKYASLNESDSDLAGQEKPFYDRPRQRPWATVLACIVVVQSLIIIVFAIYWARSFRISDAVCAAQLAPYSPYLESGAIQYVDFTDQNHLMQPSPYRGQPTLEVEEAWMKLWRMPMIHFPAAKMSLLNKSDTQLFEQAAQPDGDMLGFLNVFHELHCLNMIRQYTYREQYDYSNVTAFRAPPELVRGHVDHCIETIRKQLMCTADVTPVVFVKDETRRSGSRSDFNIRRKCVDYSRVQEWALENHAIGLSSTQE